MQDDMDELIYVKFEVTIVEALIKLDPHLYKKVQDDRSRQDYNIFSAI